MASPDLNNIQGDIILGFPKEAETFFFFRIDAAQVKKFLGDMAKLMPLITTAAHVESNRSELKEHRKTVKGGNDPQKPIGPPLVKMSGVNIAFTRHGLDVLSDETTALKDDIGDSSFNKGMFADAFSLGDRRKSNTGPYEPDWIPEFKREIHGLILVAGDSHSTVSAKLEEIKTIFSVGKKDASIYEVLKLRGHTRPGRERGHEHFGFLDAISQPAVKGIGPQPSPGEPVAVPQGVILLGRDGDAPDVPNVSKRPDWALDGTFLCFRYLPQLVPEFNAFLKRNALPKPAGASGTFRGDDFLGARLIGRWQSGAPIDLTPLTDNPGLARANDFSYTVGNDQTSQERCPFAAHTRKTNPRQDLEAIAPGVLPSRRIIRRGIQFGPEVTNEEDKSNETIENRGLLFVSYQSVIANGFKFIQQSWANNINFPPKTPPAGHPAATFPGFDAIIGQTVDAADRTLSGTLRGDEAKDLDLTREWVVAKGGGYFFSPSIPTLKNVIAIQPQPLPPGRH